MTAAGFPKHQITHMKNSLIITLMLVSGFLLQAQTDTLINQLPEITIRENRLELPFSDVSRSIEVISARQIEALPVQSVSELLQYLSGVDIRQRGVHGVQADVGIRGGTFDQTLVLINGIKMSDPQTGHHAMNLPIDLENIERVEVLKGPGARIYGQNAFTGAINIVTKTPESAYSKIALQAGSFEMGGIAFSAALPGHRYNQYVSFSKRFAQGYRYNTDYDINNFFYQGQLQAGVHQLRLLAGYSERRFGANGFYASPRFVDQFEAIQTSVVGIEDNWRRGNWSFKPRVYWRRNQDEYIFNRSNPAAYRNLHITNTGGFEFHASHVNRWGITGLGAEIGIMGMRSNNLGARQRSVANIFAEHRFLFWGENLDITPGIAFYQYSDFGSRIFPGIDLGYRFSNQLKLFANAGYTFRIPTYTDLYYQDPANLGNPDLKPEAAISWEVGFKGSSPRGMQWQLSWFARDAFDLIDWTRSSEDLPWQPDNIARLYTSGLDFNTQLHFPGLFAGETPLQRMYVAYTYINAQLGSQDSGFSRYALENLRHQLILGLEFRIGKKLYHSINYRYLDRVSLEDYALVDSKIVYKTNTIELFVAANNILGQEYRETNLVPMPGRWLQTGISKKF